MRNPINKLSDSLFGTNESMNDERQTRRGFLAKSIKAVSAAAAVTLGIAATQNDAEAHWYYAACPSNLSGWSPTNNGQSHHHCAGVGGGVCHSFFFHETIWRNNGTGQLCSLNRQVVDTGQSCNCP